MALRYPLLGNGEAIPFTRVVWVVPFCLRQREATSDALGGVG